MRKSIVAAFFAGLFASPVLAAPTLEKRYSPYPLPDGFPNPSPTQILTIEEAAGGTLSNAPLPATISAEGSGILRLIALVELFEVAYFTELLHIITNCKQGYTDFGIFSKSFVVDTITAIVNQEQLHGLAANGALKAFNAGPILPCQCTFPVTIFDQAVDLAATVHDVISGTLQAAEAGLAVNGDSTFVPLIASVVGQEGKQQGFYRIAHERRPSSSPFLTASASLFAFTSLQEFIIPGSSPNINTIKIPTLLSMSLSGTYIAYISGQSVVVVKPLTNVVTANGKTTFSAFFPFEGGSGFARFSNGLTIAAVTRGAGPFANTVAVANAAVYGPGLIGIG